MSGPNDAVTPEELESWRSFVGRKEVRRENLGVETLRRFAVAVGSSPEVELHAPPLAHWAYFLEALSTNRLGTDGHPVRGGGILPPVRLPRRMFAAASIGFVEPLTLGEDAELSLTLADVRHRVGTRGVFVDVDRVLTQRGRNRVVERQTIVYCAAEPIARVDPAELPAGLHEEMWTPNAVELFRFSAVTFNAHRIHYDLSYAQLEEGYPNLVVHGPLIAIKLLAFALRWAPGSPRRFEFRARAPLFSMQPVRIVDDGGPSGVAAVRCDGAIAMSAKIEP